VKTYRKFCGSRGFTVAELLVAVMVVFVLALVLLPPMVKNRRHYQPHCLNNLKQVGLAFRLWSSDNGDMYPMRFFTNHTGGLLFADSTNLFRYFQVMSDELSTPKVLICPQDTKRQAATNFTTDLNNNRLSYFVGLDSDETGPQTFLAGDRNLTNGQPKTNGILYLRSNQNVGWTKELHNECGNVAMGDGSVQQLNNAQIAAALAKTGLVTNRFLFP
jgi:hypothetical protein